MGDADTLVYSTEKQVSEHEEKLGDADKDAIKEACDKVKDLLAKDASEVDIDEIKKATEELQAAAQKIGQAIYGDQAGAGADGAVNADGGADGEKKDNDENVVDAEYKDKEEGSGKN